VITAERVAVVGSREYPIMRMVEAYLMALPDHTIVITGGARGVDREAERVARLRQMMVVVIKPDYLKHGPRAPLERNRTIAQTCSRMVAFWDGKSSGTAHVVSLAKQLGKPVMLIRPEMHEQWRRA
jgi:predicted Rossmann fold nucleotide-binding protein DprA/Smf involved in DNA uptake